MTENVSTVTKYAIRLPNGKLCNDLPNSKRMYPDFERLPDGTTAYLWSNKGDAHGQINDMAFEMRHYGMSDAFPDLAKVVEVRIIVEIWDITEDGVADAPIADSEPAGEPEPRTWDSIGEIPVGVRFTGSAGWGVYEQRQTDCLNVKNGVLYPFSDFGSFERAYVEVLS
jgi:hypothetical protein